MKLIPAEKVPGKSVMKNVLAYIDEFVAMDATTVEVVFNGDEYANDRSAYQAFHNAIKKNGHPVRVMTRKGKVFLTKVQ